MASATLCGYVIDATAGGVSWTRTLGIRPDQGSIPVIWTGDVIPADEGDLVISHDGVTITIPNVRVESTEPTRGAGGKHITCVVTDRRWRWAYGGYVGEANRPAEDGTPLEEYSARELAGFLLDEMGETGYDVSALSADVYPHVVWEYANPAAELQKLCEDNGCAIALLLTDVVKIVRVGVGAAFPAGSVKEDAAGEKLTDRPDVYAVVGGRSVIQTVVPLDAVGLDTDGSIKFLKDLSYAPEPLDDYGGFTAGLDGLDLFSEAWKRATESVWRWYRMPADWLYVLPLLDEVVETETVDGVLRRKKPYVTSNEPTPFACGSPGPLAPAGVMSASDYEIDCKLGIVKFATGYCLSDSPTPLDPAAAWRPVSFSLTFAAKSVGPEGIRPEDYYLHLSGAIGAGDTVQTLPHPEMIAYGIEDPDTWEITWQNTDELAAAADIMISAADPGAASFSSKTAVFTGLKTFDLDGKMRSITYRMSSAGIITDCQWNIEFPKPGAPTYNEKLRRANLTRASHLAVKHEGEAVSGAPAVGLQARGAARRDDEITWAKNVSGLTCPRGGTCMIAGYDNAAGVEKICPAMPGYLGVAVAAAQIAPGATGPIWKKGAHPVYTPGAAGIYPGDRFTGNGRFGPLGYYYGPMFGVFLVRSVIYTGETSGDGYPLSDWLIAEIMSDNGCDMTYVGGNAGTGFHAMAADTLAFGAEFAATEWHPGKVTIGGAP